MATRCWPNRRTPPPPVHALPSRPERHPAATQVAGTAYALLGGYARASRSWTPGASDSLFRYTGPKGCRVRALRSGAGVAAAAAAARDADVLVASAETLEGAGLSELLMRSAVVVAVDEADASLSPFLPANAGRQIQLKPPPAGGSAWAPGNYGLLALPDGSQGASDISAALAAVQPENCYTLDVSTAPGVKTNKVQDGINARFDLPGGLPHPAPNVMNYPKDPEIAADASVVMGNGNWDLDGYWTDRHVGPLPTDLAGASRYQVYLYEQGLEFTRNGKQTVYPIDSALPTGFAVVTPPGVDIPADATDPDNPFVDGAPSTAVAENGHARRLVQIAVLQCSALGVKGSHTYPTSGAYVEAFVTQTVENTPAGGIYVEIHRQLTTTNDPEFHANVRLVE